MTPPAKAPAVKQPAPDASATVTADAKTPPPPKVDATPPPPPAAATDPDPLTWNPLFRVGLGFGAQGGINGSLFGINAVSTYGEYKQLNVGGGILWDLIGFGDSKKVRWSLGGMVDYNGTFGNENTGSSNLHQLTIGPRTELNWVRAWGVGLGSPKFSIKGPSYIGIDGGIGYGWGTTIAETFSLHSQSGLAAYAGADVNVFNMNFNNLEVDANARFQTNGIFGSEFNSTGNYIGFNLTFRPGVNKKIVKEPETCTDTNATIDDYTKQNADLRAENTKIQEDLNTLKGLLQQGKDPLTPEKIQSALYYREVRLAIIQALPAVEEEKVRGAIKEAIVAKPEADTDAILKKGIPGLTDDILKAAKETANKKYPKGYDYWAQINGDPDVTKLPEPLPTDCKELEKLMKQMLIENGDLKARKASLIGRFDTAVLLDALKDFLGKAVEKFIDRAHGFVLDFVQPNFTLAKPTDADIKALQEFADKKKGQVVTSSDSELIKITGRMFALPEWEVQNFSDLADKMNGKLDPSFTRTFKQGDKAKNFDKAPTVADGETKFAWMRDVEWFIEGHTDSQGDEASNQALSERRAKAGLLMLQIFGVPADHLDSKGYGETRLAVPESGNYQQIQTAQNKNRRLVIRVKGEKPSAANVSIPDGKSVNVDPTKPPPDGQPSDKPAKAPVKPVAKPPAPPPTGTTVVVPPKPPAKDIDFGDDDKKKK